MLKLTTDKHEASRGLSATAELLVWHNDAHAKCVHKQKQKERFLHRPKANSTLHYLQSRRRVITVVLIETVTEI